jgi:protein-L-isoaspartate(D-aspartate) O-methyltransferase
MSPVATEEAPLLTRTLAVNPILILVLAAGGLSAPSVSGPSSPPAANAAEAGLQELDDLRRERLRMVRIQILAKGVRDPATLEAMRTVAREEFVLPRDRDRAYGDHPLAIGFGQSISQPYMVAYMTEQIRPRPGMRILEVGTGSGYQAAILAEAGARVYTIEIFEELARTADERLRRLGYSDVEVRHGDGYQGWEEEAPFDAIMVTAAAGYLPPPLLEQLRVGGRMLIPVGSVYGVQNLVLVEKGEDGELTTQALLPVRFVPLLRGLH